MLPINASIWRSMLIAISFGALVLSPAAAQTARDWASQRTMMVEAEVATGGVKQPAILAVMRSVPRHEFVPAKLRQYSYMDMGLPIGERQTISPPFIVGYMTQQIDPQPTDRILEIGTGSGYQAAILSGLAKEVYTIEISPRLGHESAKTLKRLGYKNVKTKIGDGYQGWPEAAPFDKIIVTCSPEKVPRPLIDQLREGGKMIVPLGERFQQTLYTFQKQNGQLVVRSREPTFFVPMTGQAESQRVAKSDESFTPLANGDFESSIAPGKPEGWYYMRQATIESAGPAASAPHCVSFSNAVPGRSSQLLQAIGVDGRRVAELAVELWVKAHDITPGESPEEQARVLVSFFDEDRSPVGQQFVGPWTGSFDWQRRSARLQVPAKARVAIVAVGLLGATGQLSCDQISIHPTNVRSASR